MVNLIDRAIAAVSPARALKRAQARAALAKVQAYAGGDPAPGGVPWSASRRGPRAQLAPVLSTLRNRSREVFRDNEWCQRALQVRSSAEVGYGIKPRPRTWVADSSQPGGRRKAPKYDVLVWRLWEEWIGRACFAGSGLDLYGLQAQMSATRIRDGEALMRIVPLDPAEARRRRLRVPLQLETMEADSLDDTVALTLAGRTGWSDGIELGPDGRPAFFRVLRQHPGEALPTLSTDRVDRVPASRMIHLWRRHAARPGQLRGAPDIAGALLRIRRLTDFEDATLDQARTAALLGVITISPDPIESFGTSAGMAYNVDPEAVAGSALAGAPLTELRPGMVASVATGTDVKVLQPPGPGAFSPLAQHHLRAIAAALGVEYHEATGDLSQANYSSLRAGRIVNRRLIAADQWLMLVPLLCAPIWEAFIDAAVMAGELPDGPEYLAEWDPPHAELVDPAKEIPAIVASIRAGLSTWQQEVSAQGYDPETQARQIAEANALHDDLGLILTGDPRRISNGGQAQDAGQNAAIEIAATGAAAPRRQDAEA